MIPRPRISEKLQKEVVKKLSETFGGYDELRDSSLSQEERDLLPIAKDDLKTLSEAGSGDVRNLRGDLRFAEAVAAIQAKGNSFDEVLFGSFLKELDAVVASHSTQKRFMASKLRTLSDFIKQVKQNDPISWQKVKLFQQEEGTRRDAALSGTYAQEFNAGDEYKGLLRGLIANDKTRAQLELVLNRESRRISERVKKERLQNGSYVPLLVLGAGVHSAIFTSELMRTNPDLARSAVVVESRKVLGGQFRDVGGVGYFMNSRVRPHNYLDADENLPGRRGNINSFGNAAPLQLPDVEDRTYSDNARIGLVAAMNSFLTADTALGMEVVQVRRRTDQRSFSGGKYEVELRDTETGAKTLINTDCVVSSTGLGTPSLPFDESDPETKIVIERREKDYLVGPMGEVPGLPKIATSEEFWQFAGNSRNWQPLKELAGREIIIVGDADSAQTILEKLNGFLAESTLDTATSMQIAAGQNNDPINVTIIGAKQPDFETYIKGRRVRYHFVALFYPRADQSRENATINPVAGKATKLRSSFGTNRVLYTGEDGVERQSNRASLIITSTGFKDTSSEVFADFDDTNAGREFDRVNDSRILEGLSRAGTVFKFMPPGSNEESTLTITETEYDWRKRPRADGLKSLVRFSLQTPILRLPNRQLSARDFLDQYRGQIVSAQFPPEKLDPFYVLEEKDRPVGKQLFKGDFSQNIFVIGVAGKRAFSEKEKESYPDATKKAVEILVNADAMWRLAEGTALMARKYVNQEMQYVDWQEKVREQDKTRPEVAGQLGMPSGEKLHNFVLSLDTESDEGELPSNVDALAFLQETLSRKLATWRLDSKDASMLKTAYDNEVKFQFVRTFRDTYVIVMNPPLYPASVLRDIFSSVQSEDARDLRRAIKALLRDQGSSDNIATVLNKPNLQRVMRYSDSLTLIFEYDGKHYEAIGSKRKKLDLLQGAPDNAEILVDSSPPGAGFREESEFFGGLKVSSGINDLVRRALTGLPIQEQKPQTFGEVFAEELRKELGVTADSNVTYLQAEKLFAANALTFENFSKMISDFAKRQESSFAVKAFDGIFKEPFTLKITAEQKNELLSILQKAQRDTFLGDTGNINWTNLITRVSQL